ncbi:Succinyl-CoA--L-malate CoA-transferase beta subunit [compost metagenome]
MDIFRDPHIAAREGIVSVHDDELGPVRMQSVVPRFSATPGAVHHAGPSLGQHNDEVLGALGFSGAQQAGLRERGVI